MSMEGLRKRMGDHPSHSPAPPALPDAASGLVGVEPLACGAKSARLGLIKTGWTLETHDQTEHVSGSRPIEVICLDESASWWPGDDTG